MTCYEIDGDGRCIALFFDDFYWENYYCNKSKDQKKMNTNCKNTELRG